VNRCHASTSRGMEVVVHFQFNVDRVNSLERFVNIKEKSPVNTGLNLWS